MKLPLKLNRNSDTYWTLNKALSYDPHLIMVAAPRGIGKTTQGSFECLGAYQNDGRFVYMRRYTTELDEWASKDGFSNVLDGVYYKNHKGIYTYFFEGQVMGYGIPLSKYRTAKSVNYSTVSRIIYDEVFCKPNGTYHYLKNEVEAFLEFLSTVERTRPGNSVRAILLGNNEDLFNPYFEYFKIPPFDKYYYDKDRGLYCEAPLPSEKLKALEEKTGLYKLTKGTDYFNYHYNNALLGSTTKEIIEKPPQAKYFCRCCLNETTLSIYTYYKDGVQMLWCESKEKLIVDAQTYIIKMNNNWNYYYAQLFKAKLKNWIYRFYYNKLVTYSSDKAGDMMAWLMETI